MDESSTIVTWLVFVMHVVVLIAVIGVTLGLVRRASASGAYILAAAAGIQLLLSCCMRAANVAMRQQFGYSEPMVMGLTCVSLLGELVTVALIAYAFVTLSRAITNPVKPSPIG